MRYGVIDIGSNTIRGVAYQTEGNRAVKIEDKLVRSHILQEMCNRVLSTGGINRLIVILNKLVFVLRDAGCQKIGCFSTAALRGLENLEQIKRLVLETTGIEIHALSGEEEAKYDFMALRAGVPEHSAIGLDLGGGSCQILQFERQKILFSGSYTIGSNVMRSRFVEKNIPSLAERKKIVFWVRNELMDLENKFGSRYIYAMGGTAKSALKLYSRLSNTLPQDSFLSVEKLEKLCRIGDSDPDGMYELYTKIVKNRADTIIPGIVVLHTICKTLDVEGIYVLQCGIRDGYLIEMRKNSEDF